jgi:hypothetical protein
MRLANQKQLDPSKVKEDFCLFCAYDYCSIHGWRGERA